MEYDDITDKLAPLRERVMPDHRKEEIRTRLMRELTASVDDGVKRHRFYRSATQWSVVAATVVFTLFGGAYALRGEQRPTGRNGVEGVKTQMAEQPISLTSIRMMDTQNGWGITANHAVVVTHDGALTWSSEDLPMHLITIDQQSFFLNARDGWIASSMPNGSVEVDSTQDVGMTWQRGVVPTLQGMVPLDINFLDPNTGWLLLGSGQTRNLLGTNDGEASWNVVSKASRQLGTFVRFIDAKKGWTNSQLGETQDLSETSDGGRTWHIVAGLNAPIGTRQRIFAPILSNEGVLLPIERLNIATGQISMFTYFSSDRGVTWTLKGHITFTNRYNSMTNMVFQFANSNYGWIINGTRLYHTVNGGSNWQSVTSAQDFSDTTEINFYTARDGWILIHGKLLKTTDGGLIWVQTNSEVLLAAHS